MSEKIDISKHVEGICEALGLESTFVGHLSIDPHKVVADVYRKDEDGSKYVDEETRRVAMDSMEFLVKT